MRLINHWNSFPRGTVPFLPLKSLTQGGMSFSRKFCNSANCSTRCRSRGVKCCVMQEFRLERIVMFSFGLCVCGFRLCGIGKGQVCKLKRGCSGKQRLGTTHGAQVCGGTDVQLCARGAQRSIVSSSWSKTRPGRLQDGAGFALWFALVWLLSLPVAPTHLSDCYLQTRC